MWSFIVAAMGLSCAPSLAPERVGPALHGAAIGDDPPYSVVLILLDDARADDLWAMPWVSENMLPLSLSFENAYVNTPECCPARASIAAGGFLAQSTGVLSNYTPNGGAGPFDDTRTMAARLQSAGFSTAMYGKYLHGQPVRTVPRGWSSWALPALGEDWHNYDVAVGSSTVTRQGTARWVSISEYLTDYLATRSVRFIESAASDPFFLWFNPWAPHYPATPADEDVGTYEGITLRPPSFNEADVDDKPRFIRNRSRIGAARSADIDRAYQSAMESLLAADRAVKDIIETLDELGRLDDTVVILTSDNGYLYGEHRMTTKGMPYQESIKVPLLIMAPGGATGVDSRLVSVTTDVPATIQELAGLDLDTEGESLVPVLAGYDPTWRDNLFIEAYEATSIPAWSGVVSRRWKYLEYTGGEKELYDLLADPYELTSLHRTPALASRRESMATWVSARRGLSMRSDQVRFVSGEYGEQTVSAWGGTPPYTFSTTATLPTGLSLSSDGTISGTPTTASTWSIPLKVTGSGTRAHSGATEVFTQTLRIVVESASGSSGFTAPDPGERLTIRDDGFDLEVPAPAGLPVFVTISPNADFGDGRRFEAVGPDAVFHFDDLLPGSRYDLRIEGLGEPVEREVRIPG